jgi:predicted N-acetyltransferase YhbS
MWFSYLCDRPEFAPAIAAAHLAAFGPMLPDWTLEQATAELRSHTQRSAIPTTMIALRSDGGEWLGSVSLLQNDDKRIRQYSPWLASLYVRPEARGAGVALALIERCIEEARALGVERLHLYCEPSLIPFYARIGWSDIDRAKLGATEVSVMAIDVGADSIS